jgi:hypothetical protein
MASAVRESKDRLTPAQQRAILYQRGALGLDEDTYRTALRSYRCCTAAPQDAATWPVSGTPCTSSKHLSRGQARNLITRWSIAGAPVGGPYSGSKVAAKAQAAAGVTTLPTPAQRALIERLVAEIPWRTPDGYLLWLASRASPVRGGTVRTYADAEAVIEGLKGMRR